MKKILIPTLLAAVATPVIGLVSCNKSEDKAIDFNTCDWTIVTDACKNLEQGAWTAEQFCQTFKFGKVHPKTLDDFAGQTRTIKLNGIDHKIFVVGCQQDYLDQAATKPVALTFQFDNLVSNSFGVAFSPKWDETDNSNYWESTLCDQLNNDDGQTGNPSVYEMIKIGNSSLAYEIKSVSRGVCTKVGGSWQTTSNKTKLFCPTLSNLFSNKGINDTRSIFDTNKVFYKSEGQPHSENEQAQYKYYTSEIGDSPIEQQSGSAIKFPCLVRKDYQDNPYPYWLSSSLLSTDNKACAIDQAGQRIYYEVNKAEGGTLAPCFCL